jgi:hypothetical protein
VNTAEVVDCSHKFVAILNDAYILHSAVHTKSNEWILF